MTILKHAFFVGLVFVGCGGDTGGNPEAADTGASETTASNHASEDLKDISKFELTTDRMNKYFEAQHNLYASMKSMTPQQREAAGASTGNNDDLETMIAKAEANQLVTAAARKAGISTREYVMVSVALFQSMMAASIAEMQPNANQDSIIRSMDANPKNVQFIKEHGAEFEQKQKALQAEAEAMGLSN